MSDKFTTALPPLVADCHCLRVIRDGDTKDGHLAKMGHTDKSENIRRAMDDINHDAMSIAVFLREMLFDGGSPTGKRYCEDGQVWFIAYVLGLVAFAGRPEMKNKPQIDELMAQITDAIRAGYDFAHSDAPDWTIRGYDERLNRRKK